MAKVGRSSHTKFRVPRDAQDWLKQTGNGRIKKACHDTGIPGLRSPTDLIYLVVKLGPSFVPPFCLYRHQD